ERLRRSCACLGMEPPVGRTTSALRAKMEKRAPLILATTAAWEREGIAQGESGPRVGSVDATFVERMMGVFLDLVSGSVWREEVADDRTYETWYERGTARLEPRKTAVLSLVSDRAKALSKLAETGLEGPSLPEVFPLLHALATGDSLAIWSQWKTARQALSRAQEHGATCQASGASEAQIESAQAAVAAGEADVAHWPQVRDTYRGHLRAMSGQLHPWRVTDSTPQSSQ